MDKQFYGIGIWITTLLHGRSSAEEAATTLAFLLPDNTGTFTFAPLYGTVAEPH